MRYEESGNLTVRLGTVIRYCKSFGAVRCCGISYGAVLKNMKSYGAVRCGFQKLRCGSGQLSDIVNPSLRFGAVIYRTVRSAGFPVERFFLQCGSTLRRENRTTPFFLHGSPYE